MAGAAESQSHREPVLCCAVNRVGTDPACHYSGGTLMIDPYGKVVAQCPMDEEAYVSAETDLEALCAFREKFPVLKDAD